MGKLPGSWQLGRSGGENAETDFLGKRLLHHAEIVHRNNGDEDDGRDFVLTRGVVLSGLNRTAATVFAGVAAFIGRVNVRSTA